MKIVVEVISKEIIKPASSNILDDHRRYKLSFLDQLSPFVFNPLILFYPIACSTKSNNTKTYSNRLKRSLSEAQTRYHPISGRLRGNNYVDCSAERGVPYVEARVNCQLAQLAEDPTPEEFTKLLPFEQDQGASSEFLFGVQLNILECGGIVLGVSLSHKVGDASALLSFIKSWSATSRGVGEMVPTPEFVSAGLFPPVEFDRPLIPDGMITNKDIVTKRFVFPAASIEALRSKFASSPSLTNQPPPSRVETLSAFIWKRFVVGTGKLKGSSDPSNKKVYYMVHLVNLRSRLDQPLSESSFGNLYCPSTTTISIEGVYDKEYCGSLVSQVRDSIKKVGRAEFVRRFQQGKEFLGLKEERVRKGGTNREKVGLNFTSLCRFPLYDADFGWGKPSWVGAPSLGFSNLVVFMDTASGGVEALVHLKEEEMKLFQEDEGLQHYVLPINKQDTYSN